MTTHRVEQLAPGDSVEQVLLLTGCQVRLNRQGAPYLQLELRDRTGSIEGRFWNVGEELARRFDPGDFVLTKGKVQAFQGGNQLIVTAIEPVDPATVNATDYLPPGIENTDVLFARLREFLIGLKNPLLRGLMECFLIDEELMAAFRQAPAGIRVHHAYRGGLLEHVVTMLEIADRIAPLYAGLSRDLLIAGVFLHDIGKLEELSYAHTFGYTDPGQLVGHLVLGVGLLREKVTRAEELLGEPFPHELRLRLEHLIVSHHGSLEQGSPKVPMTPEAIALHYIDTLDSKLHAVLRELRETPAGAGWTAFNPTLNRRLYRGAAESDEGV
ncbi:MAG: hypothetical protein KatS3mg108_3426 [Isosphaeraceae bacterium]|nr:MAG: hypothetical protein KatS3mg108_3426 [Isosphaeraceae bacterium]